MTLTEAKQVEGFRTPNSLDPIWFENPPATREDAEDKKTPDRRRYVHGDWYVLIETIAYVTFPPPEVREAMKAAGKKVVPFKQFCVRIHMLHSTRLVTRTLRVYLHQGKMRYADSLDLNSSRDVKFKSCIKSTLDGRDQLVQILKNAANDDTSIEQASFLLGQWTCGC